MTATWAQKVKVLPGKELTVLKDRPVEMTLVNGSKQKLAFKLRTTRLHDVKPTLGIGELPPGARMMFDVNYDPSENARPISPTDRITVLLHELPPNMTAAEFWKKNTSGSEMERVVIALKPPLESTESSDVTTESTATTSGTTESGATTSTQMEQTVETTEPSETTTSTSTSTSSATSGETAASEED